MVIHSSILEVQGMMTANLTLPGDFAFDTSIQVTSNGYTSNQV